MFNTTIKDFLTQKFNRLISGISIDSRTIHPNELFIAIKGPYQDGHDYIKEAISKGACAIILSKKKYILPEHSSVSWILVDDTLQAFINLAKEYRKQFLNIHFIAITGSNGKTTTKEMLSCILEIFYQDKILKTQGNKNNQLGVPLTIFNLKKEHKAAVIEMGTNSKGEISQLCDIVKPDVGIITNIGPSHLEGLGNIAAVKEEKSALIKSLPNSGLAILNEDDKNSLSLKKEIKAQVKTFGFSKKADYSAKLIKQDLSGIEFALNEKYIVKLNKCVGIHYVYNALAALAAANFLIPNIEECIPALEKFSPVSGRFNVEEKDSVILINDTYNANPYSFASAIETIKKLKYKRLIIFAGDMLELGSASKEFHISLGSQIAELKPYYLFCIGQYASFIAKGAQESGLKKEQIIENIEPEKLDFKPEQGDLILFKGSRGIKMERFFEKINK